MPSGVHRASEGRETARATLTVRPSASLNRGRDTKPTLPRTLEQWVMPTPDSRGGQHLPNESAAVIRLSFYT
jgi:hypothetical protein